MLLNPIEALVLPSSGKGSKIQQNVPRGIRPEEDNMVQSLLRPVMAGPLVVLLILGSSLVAPATAQLDLLRQQLGSYLPPSYGPAVQCKAVVRTTTLKQYQTTTVLQPFTVAQTQTRRAQALATATMAVTTTMQRVEQRQKLVPVTRTFEVTGTVTRTQVQQVPFQPPPVTSFFTSTDIRVQTSVNQQFVTQTQTSVRPVVVTSTQFNTQFSTSFVAQTQQVTSQFRQRDVERTVTSTQQIVRTQPVQAPPFTSNVQTQRVMTSQFVQFFTPRPQTRTQTVQRTSVSTAFERIVRTQQAVATREVVRTQAVQVTTTLIQTQTSTRIVQQPVIRTSIVERVVTSTQVIPQYITSTSIFNQVNNQFVTQTRFTTLVQTQTVQGLADVREQIITTFSNFVRTVTNNRQADAATVFQTVTRPCQQQQAQTTQAGYNYNAPNTPFNF